MAIVKNDIPQLFRAGLKTLFFQTFGEMAANWDRVTTLIMSEKNAGPYTWLNVLRDIEITQ